MWWLPSSFSEMKRGGRKDARFSSAQLLIRRININEQIDLVVGGSARITASRSPWKCRSCSDSRRTRAAFRPDDYRNVLQNHNFEARLPWGSARLFRGSAFSSTRLTRRCLPSAQEARKRASRLPRRSLDPFCPFGCDRAPWMRCKRHPDTQTSCVQWFELHCDNLADPVVDPDLELRAHPGGKVQRDTLVGESMPAGAALCIIRLDRDFPWSASRPRTCRSCGPGCPGVVVSPDEPPSLHPRARFLDGTFQARRKPVNVPRLPRRLPWTVSARSDAPAGLAGAAKALSGVVYLHSSANASNAMPAGISCPCRVLVVTVARRPP
jgi:hypothetical protein